MHQLVPDFNAQNSALNHRMMVVESCIDPRVLNFVHLVSGAGEVVRRMSDQAIHRELQIRSWRNEGSFAVMPCSRLNGCTRSPTIGGRPNCVEISFSMPSLAQSRAKARPKRESPALLPPET